MQKIYIYLSNILDLHFFKAINIKMVLLHLSLKKIELIVLNARLISDGTYARYKIQIGSQSTNYLILQL